MLEKNKLFSSYKDQGYVILREVFSREMLLELKHSIYKSLKKFAKELDTTYANYTYCTGRWSYPSPIYNSEIFTHIDQKLREILTFLFESTCILKKRNMICKNEYAVDRVPLHQDISYSHKDPYHLSAWLALDNISIDSGELVVIPSSHRWEIESARDFWSPLFVDNKWKKYHKQFMKIYLRAGDILFFNSCLWHGSKENLKGSDRYAYVTRWIIEEQELPKLIPEPRPMQYGMWNCYSQTIDAMSTLQLTNNNNHNQQKLEKTLEEMIKDCIKDLQTGRSLNIPYKAKAIQSLFDLKVLHQAASLHNAGDLCGNVYKNLWFSLLQHV